MTNEAEFPPLTTKEAVDAMKRVSQRLEAAVEIDQMSSSHDKLVSVLTEVFGLGIWDDSVEETAGRVIRYWQEYSGASGTMDFNLTTFPTEVNQMIVVNNIEFSSMCAHHLLPFFGIAHVAYIPNQLAVGLSKIPRIVDHFAHRPQMQERLTKEIASFLKTQLEAMGVAVVVVARHTCMACRGIRKHNGHMTTSEMRGVFLTGKAAKQEFLELIKTEVTL